MDTRVGVRELRRWLSRYLDRVGAAERVVVTEHGRPVAVLSPWLDPSDPLERLVAEGRATRPLSDLLAVRPLERTVSRRGSEALGAEREERLA